jgi:hypothetical protein
MILQVGVPKHCSIESIVILKTTKQNKPEHLGIKINHPIQLIGWSRNAKVRLG